MNNLFNPADSTGILTRLGTLTPDRQRQWGKMDVAQMLAHCSASLGTAMGLDNPKKLPLIARLIGAMMKAKFVGEKPFPKNSATDKSYIITDARSFEAEKADLISRIRAFSDGGPAACNTRPHVFFGKLTPVEWATMQWKHFDHHLRQFGA